MAKSFAFLALIGLSFFVLASCQDNAQGSSLKQDPPGPPAPTPPPPTPTTTPPPKPVVTCPTTTDCKTCLTAANNSCSMIWDHNNTASCVPSLNIDSNVCYSMVSNITDCPNMAMCMSRTTCEVCVPENTTGCIWCNSLNRCASNFTHVTDMDHDLITDFKMCTPPTPAPNATTTTAPTTTSPAANTTTVIPPTPAPPTPTPTPGTNSTTTASTNTTTPLPVTTPMPPTAAPATDRRFDGPSFIGGIVLALGCMAISFVAWKFYKARTERNYHTL